MKVINWIFRVFRFMGQPSREGVSLSRTQTERPSSGMHNLTPDPKSVAQPKRGEDPLRKRLFPDGKILGPTVIHDPEDPVVDIIFVHGLTGDSYSTWVIESGGKHVYWPLDMLSREIPNARIATWGYDVDVTKPRVGPVSQCTIGEHARDLEGDLRLMRADEGAARRKIIFVAHGLGGLVTKDAICHSRKSDYQYFKRLYQHTIGFAFLGTCSAQATKIILKLARKCVNAKIMQVLDPESQLRWRIEDDFARCLIEGQRAGHFVCIFEPKEHLVVEMVGGKASARAYPWQKKLMLKNYMDMTNFGSTYDEGYRQLLDKLKEWVGLRSVSS